MGDTEATTGLIEKRYEEVISYYWEASKKNKRVYKSTRVLVVILGALVTLITSLSSADFVIKNSLCHSVFAITAPVLAAALAVVGGLSQTFQLGLHGGTWF